MIHACSLWQDILFGVSQSSGHFCLNIILGYLFFTLKYAEIVNYDETTPYVISNSTDD